METAIPAPAVQLRDAQPTDFARLLEIDRVCFPPDIAYSAAELREGMNGRQAFTLIAEAERGGIAGFLVGRAEVGGRGHIITIDVLPDFQRRGVGKLLMAEAERRFRALLLHSVLLETAVNNDAAIGFYQRLGYVVIKTLRGYYNRKLDALLMLKPLERGKA